MWWRALGLCFVWFVASAGAALAQARGPALNWTRQPGAESCIASVELASRVEERIKRRVFVAAPDAIVAVEGSIAPQPGGAGFIASISMSDGKGVLYGSRELKTPSACRDLDDALTFVIAVTLRPEEGQSPGIELPESVLSELDTLFGAEPSEPDPAQFPLAEMTRDGASRARGDGAVNVTSVANGSQAVARAQAPPRTRTLFVELLGNAHSGLQPSGTLAGALGVRLRAAQLGEVSAQAALGVQTNQEVVDGSVSSEADFNVWLVSLGYCTSELLSSRTLGLAPCAAFRLGAVRVRTAGFSATDGSGSSLLSSVGLGLRARWSPLDRVELALAVGPELRVLRSELAYTSASGETRPLHRTELIGASAEISLGFALF